MNYKYIIFFGCLMFIALAFGCIGGGESTANETKLEVTEGVGVVGTLKIDALNPGLDGYVQLTVRNNLGGEVANNVTISLDNVNPFKIYDCGNANIPETIRPLNCGGEFDYDRGLPYSQHKTSRLSPGEEIDVLWRIRAPSKDEISNIVLKHPLYYDVTYTYKTGFHQNMIFMSQQEQLRRKQIGEDYQITGESGNTAGELRMSSTTQQPIIFFFSNGTSGTEQPFNFPLQFSVENQGTGIPLSDVIVLFEYPANMAPSDEAFTTYSWHKWSVTDQTCTTSEQESVNCTKLIIDTFGDDLNTMAKDRLLYKVVKKEDFIQSFNVYMPLSLTSAELTSLKQNNIPLKIYTFRLFTMYSYFIEGKDYINVYPIRIRG